MTVAEQNNSDLIWDMHRLSDRARAQRFVLQFQDKLCVFSGTVRQLYTNYGMHFPEDYERNLVILPNPYAFHDTFNHVNEEAITATGFHIIPGEAIKRKSLYMLIKPKDPKMPVKPIPMKRALGVLQQMRTEEDPFLPVLLKGDLKPFQGKIPCLHLHRLRLPYLSPRITSFEKQEIKRVVLERMQRLAEL